MKCSRVNVGGARAIVCGPRRAPVCACGARATLQCDWRTGKDRTCDAFICEDCALEPAPDKHLCRRHAEVWKGDPANREREAEAPR